MLNYSALRDAPLQSDPFDHVIVPDFIGPDALATINDNFPTIRHPGSFHSASLKGGPAFGDLTAALQGAEMATFVGEKFSIDLENQPTMLTVRGQCRERDGKIHRDSGGKIITVLLYLNSAWEGDGGQLRLLRSADNLEDYAATVPPTAGTLLAFRCTNNAWHGHKPYQGERRSMQLNWVKERGYLWKEAFRHNLSAIAKKILRP
jgi:SM-20-related protein